MCSIFDLSKQIDWANCWSATFEIPIAISDEYSRDIAIIKREAAIANSLTSQYIIYSMDAAGYEYDATPIVMMDGEEGGIEEYFNEPIWQQEKVENIAVYTPEEFKYTPEIYFSEANQNNIKNQSAWIGVDEVQDMVVEFTVGPYQGYQVLQTGSYGGKWYVIGLDSNLASHMGLDSYCSGLVIKRQADNH